MDPADPQIRFGCYVKAKGRRHAGKSGVLPIDLHAQTLRELSKVSRTGAHRDRVHGIVLRAVLHGLPKTQKAMKLTLVPIEWTRIGGSPEVIIYSVEGLPDGHRAAMPPGQKS